MRTAVYFQGGGALGAFGAGAWSVISTWPEVAAGELVAVAGTSIGALNAAAAAHHHAAPDRGAGFLAGLWLQRLATPPLPFAGPLPWALPAGVAAEPWNGFLTGMLAGIRGLSQAAWPAWQPAAGLRRDAQPLHDRSQMEALLEREFPAYASAATGAQRPLLAAAAVDVLSGRLRLFNSDEAAVGPLELAASSALPLVFDAVDIDGRPHWDGEVTRESALPAFLRAVRDSGRLGAREPLQLVTIEQFPAEAASVPRSGVEMAYRAVNLMQLGKMEPGRIDGLRIARHRRVVRPPLPEDGISGQFDFSPGRLGQLFELGREAASRSSA